MNDPETRQVLFKTFNAKATTGDVEQGRAARAVPAARAAGAARASRAAQAPAAVDDPSCEQMATVLSVCIPLAA